MKISSIFSKIKNFFHNDDSFKETGLYKTLDALKINITSSKKSRITGLVLSLVLIITVVLDNNAFLSQNFKSKWILLAFCLVFPLIIGAFAAFNFRFKNNLTDKIAHLVFLFVLPLLTISMTECLNNIFIYNMTYLGFIGNYILVLILYFVFFAVSGSLRVSILAVNPVLYGLALAHCYIMDFRGTPFIPMDFLSITTAVNVANTYSYKLTHLVLTGSLVFIFIMVIGIKIRTPKYNILTKIISRVFTGLFSAIILFLFYFTSVFADAGVKPDFWNQTRGYKNYGFAFNFFCNTKYLFMSAPSGYDANNVADYVEKNIDKIENVEVTETTPNIICIMNESLSDLSILGNFTTNTDYMPFMHSLTENTVKGNLYVPVIGAGTSNTEFEFLTGHTTAFLPSGSNAYMLYINSPIATMVSTLEGQGYNSVAFHPYYSSGWNRVNVYNNMNFNSQKFLENIMDISIMNEYMSNSSDPNYIQQLIDQYYPDRTNMFLRQYISDSYDFKVLIEDFQNRDRNMPYFMFNVTMQNHGGYTTKFDNFNEEIYLTSTETEYVKANRYLSLVKKSDEAFKELVDYFKTVSEPTVICMFGDHQPSVETSFIAETLGVKDLSGLTLEQEQKRHVTPFIIWANYDIQEETIDKMSSNYLSSYVLKVAGVKLTEYNRYLLNLYKQLPVIDTVGYIDAENNYYNWQSQSKYSEILSEYEKIQYNNIFDSENKSIDIFYLDGYKNKNSQKNEKVTSEVEKK